MGYRRGAVDMGVVIQEFGASNINKLLKKCYIIRIGKGVTIGI